MQWKYNMYTQTNNPNAVYGEQSQAVLDLQKKLNSQYGAGLAEDSKYGPLTKAAYDKYIGGVNTNAPIGELFTGTDFSKDPNYSAIGDIYGKQLRGEDIVDTSKIRSKKIAEVQDRIDALKQIYANQLARVKRESAGNVGSGTAILAARGLTGSIRGESIKSGINEQNRANEAAVDNAQALALADVYSAVDAAVANEAQQRREAMTSGAKNYIEFIKGEDERKKGILEQLGQFYVNSGQDPATDPNLSAVAQKLGVSTSNIIAEYKNAKIKGSTKSGSSGTGGESYFTKSQINKGAQKIKTTPDVFATLPYEEQNMLINNPESLDSQIEIINNVATGVEDVNQVFDEIIALDLSTPLRDYLLGLLVEAGQTYRNNLPNRKFSFPYLK